VATHKPHCRRQPPVELPEAIGAQPLDFGERARGRVDERRHVDALAAWRKRREISRPAREHVDRPVVISLAQMMKGDADLQNPLIEIAHVAPLGAPQEFERLVLLEVLTAIELRDSVEQQLRRSFVARRHALS